MRGAIGVPTSEQGRWSGFWQCLEELDRPADTKVLHVRGSSPARNRNVIAQTALEGGAEWVFWLDDDLTFRPDTLTRLLARSVDVVCGLSLRRQPPFLPLWLHTNHPGDLRGFYHGPFDGPDLVGLEACTSGGFLTRRRVLEAVAQPMWTLGQMGVPDEWTDDLDFCRKVREAGIPIWGDPTVRLGHLTSLEVWPHQQDGAWYRLLMRGGVVAMGEPWLAT